MHISRVNNNESKLLYTDDVASLISNSSDFSFTFIWPTVSCRVGNMSA